MAFIRLVVFGFLALSVIYLSVSIYARSVHKERLEDDFDEANPDGGDPEARNAFVDAGMLAYKASLRPKLIGLVYVIPVIAVSVIIYTVNAN